jgi:hypothetical protein
MDAAFSSPKGEEERQILGMIQEFNAHETTKLEQELFKQVKRLNDAERSLQTKQTKKALDDQRIATSKIEWAKGKLADLKRSQFIAEDSRIFPG